MTELGTIEAPAAVVTEAPSATVLAFKHPLLGDTSHDFDCATIPAETRLDFLKGKVRDYIANRLNALDMRHKKNEQVMAWAKYEAAQAADPLQSVVAKPDFAKPAEPDYADALNRAFTDLRDGKARKHGDTPKKREKKDPLIAMITNVVQKDVYEKKHAADPKYTFIQAKAEVGTDGLAYLNTMIEEKVAAAPEADRAALLTALEKLRETKYIKPAKLMLGIDESKAVKELPSIL